MKSPGRGCSPATRTHRRRRQHRARGVHGRPGARRLARRRIFRAGSLRAYAALEILVAATALLLPLALNGATPVLAWAYADGAAPARFAIVRVAISLALIGIPAAAMGATFPIAAAWLASRDKGRASFSGAGSLYAANTAGAALGALAAGFWLDPDARPSWHDLGRRRTERRRGRRRAVARRRSQKPRSPPRSQRRFLSRSQRTNLSALRVLRGFCRAGASAGAGAGVRRRRDLWFAALIYEVAWTRLLALVIGPTTYAFATMAAAFISGLAIGSAVGARLSHGGSSRPAVWLAVMLVVSAVAASGAAWYAATRLPLEWPRRWPIPAAAFGPVVAGQARSVGLLLLPMTLALGATFPLALAARGPRRVHAGRDAARVYAANTLGAIAGSLVAGFALIPALGLRSTFQMDGGRRRRGRRHLSGGGAARRRPSRTANARHGTKRLGARGSVADRAAPAVAVAAIAAIVSLPPWDPRAAGQRRLQVRAVPRIRRPRHRAARRHARVSTRKAPPPPSACGGSTGTTLAGHRRQGRRVERRRHADAAAARACCRSLLHGGARDICVIGLGSGVTRRLGAGAGHGPARRRRRDLTGGRGGVALLRSRERQRVLAQPGVRLIVGDGRSHLLLTPRSYDVIVSEPSNPWMAGVAALFTREFFEAARARLNPDGLLCQWAHTYDISPEDLQSIVADLRVGVSRRARCGWSAKATCC